MAPNSSAEERAAAAEQRATAEKSARHYHEVPQGLQQRPDLQYLAPSPEEKKAVVEVQGPAETALSARLEEEKKVMADLRKADDERRQAAVTKAAQAKAEAEAWAKNAEERKQRRSHNSPSPAPVAEPTRNQYVDAPAADVSDQRKEEIYRGIAANRQANDVNKVKPVSRHSAPPAKDAEQRKPAELQAARKSMSEANRERVKPDTGNAGGVSRKADSPNSSAPTSRHSDGGAARNKQAAAAKGLEDKMERIMRGEIQATTAKPAEKTAKQTRAELTRKLDAETAKVELKAQRDARKAANKR